MTPRLRPYLHSGASTTPHRNSTTKRPLPAYFPQRNIAATTNRSPAPGRRGPKGADVSDTAAPFVVPEPLTASLMRVLPLPLKPPPSRPAFARWWAC